MVIALGVSPSVDYSIITNDIRWIDDIMDVDIDTCWFMQRVDWRNTKRSADR